MYILSVDDSAIIRKIVASATDILGMDFLEAADGEQALEVIERHANDIALVVLDWNMPVKDGLETLQSIKSDSRFSHLKVMMVTTEGEKQNIIRAVQEGASQYLTKPFSQEDLLTKLVECLG